MQRELHELVACSIPGPCDSAGGGTWRDPLNPQQAAGEGMGLKEFEEKRALAAQSRSRAHCLELLQLARREKLREPRVVADFGRSLIESHAWGLGSERACFAAFLARGGHGGGADLQRSLERVRAGVRGRAGPARRRASRGAISLAGPGAVAATD